MKKLNGRLKLNDYVKRTNAMGVSYHILREQRQTASGVTVTLESVGREGRIEVSPAGVQPVDAVERKVLDRLFA